METHGHSHGETDAPGRVVHWAACYDLLTFLFTFGRERAFREKLLRLALLDAGESVLDIGCGTGTLAMVAKQQVGPTGTVHGIDASPEMIARAGAKARKAGLEVAFQTAAAQALPFRNATFDVVTTTLMLHHLSADGRKRMAAEISRVLKPTGRVLAVDFVQAPRDDGSFMDRFHRHGVTDIQDVVTNFRDAGLNIVASGAVGMKNLQFVFATMAADAADSRDRFAALGAEEPLGVARPGGRAHLFTAALALGVVALVALHAGVPWLILGAGFDTPSNAIAGGVIALSALVVIVKIGLLGHLHRRYRSRHHH